MLGRVPGRVPGKRGLLGGLLGAVPFLSFSRESGLPALLPAVRFFPAVHFFPALSPALLGDSGFLSPVAGGPDYNNGGLLSANHVRFELSYLFNWQPSRWVPLESCQDMQRSLFLLLEARMTVHRETKTLPKDYPSIALFPTWPTTLLTFSSLI